MPPDLLAALPTALQTAPDTVVTVVARDALGTAADWSLVVLGLTLLTLLVVLLTLLSQLRKLNRTVRALGGKALDKADPILKRGEGVADNVEFISDVVRSDVERLSRNVRALGDRLQQASDRMEERIEEFNALMEVVQDEAEEILLDTAATARGVEAGVRSLGGARRDGGALDEAPAEPATAHGDDLAAGRASPDRGSAEGGGSG